MGWTQGKKNYLPEEVVERGRSRAGRLRGHWLDCWNTTCRLLSPRELPRGHPVCGESSRGLSCTELPHVDMCMCNRNLAGITAITPEQIAGEKGLQHAMPEGIQASSPQ
jgi:hypothetical protein